MRFPILLIVAGFIFFQKTGSHVIGNIEPTFTTSTDTLECLATEMQQKLFAENPGLRSLQNALEKEAYLFFKQKSNSGAEAALSADYTLPVVFHVIHQNGPENITDAQILTALDNLNDAFANIGFYGGNDGVDTKIQFCLAKRDPDGNATTGINRVVSPLTNVDFSTDIAMKNLIRWNPLEYINIWLVRSINGGGVAGYAYLPSSHGGPEDGIVMLGAIMPNLGGGHSTLVHEMGHYLGLYHAFEGGCTNNDCLLDGDRVCDTPPDNTTAPPGNCSAIVNSCTTDTQSGFATDQNDINWNYVDYGNQPCRNGYTQGQADRMAFFIENARQSLLNSPACQDACLSPIAAGFTPSATTVNIGGTVNFTNISTGATAYFWSVNGLQFATTANASYTFNSLGSFEIELDASNADPNCGGSATATIHVVCPVSASFTTSNLYPAPGEVVSFANTSTGASSYTWTLNGTNVATSANFSTGFNSPGQYNICLLAGNGLCSEQFCQLVFVIEGNTTNGCDGTFLKLIGDAGVSEFAHTVLATPEGNLLVGGNHAEDAMIALVSPGGELIWVKTFDFLSNDEFIFEMMLDSDGRILAVGRNQLNANTENFIFKYDYQTDNVLWSRRMPNPAFTRLEILLEKAPGANYFILGMSDNDNIFMEINRNTGASVNIKTFDFGQTDNFLGAFVRNNEIYSVGVQRNGGVDKIRASMTKLDITGNQLWTRFYFNPLTDIARTYFYENLLENDTIVAYGRGDLNGQSFTDVEILLMKSDLDGNFISSKKYDFPGSTSEFSGSLVNLPDGYLLQGTHVPNATGISEYFLLRVDKQGNIEWAKSVKSVGSDWGKYATVHDGFIYFIGQSFELDAAGDLLFGKMSLDGEVVSDGCEFVTDLNVVASNLTNQYDGLHPLAQSNANYALNSFTVSPTATVLDDHYLPGCECTQFTSECNETFVTAYGSPGMEEGRNIIAVPGGFIFVTSKTDSLLFMGLDEEGKLMWQRSKHIIDGDNRVLKLSLDSEGNIFGCGTKSAGPAATWESFAFRYDYQNNIMLWSNIYNYDSGSTFFFIGMVEKPNAGNFVLFGGSEGNTAPMGHGCDAAWVEVDRNTGNITFVRSFNIGSCETFYSPVIASDGTGVYVTGRYNTAGGGQNKFRGPITKLDWSGNELWSRLYLVPVSAGSDARLYGVNLIEENNSLYTFGTGDLNGISLTDVSYQFYKTDLNGDIEWAIDYDIVGATSEAAIRALSTPDGFLMLGFFTQGNRNICLLKINKQGTLQWAKSYGGTGDELGWDMEYQNGKIFLVGKTSSFGNGGDDALLLKLDLDGNIQHTDCDFSTDLIVTTATIPNPYDGSHPLTAWTPATSLVSLPGNPQASTLTEVQLCYNPCPDTCANGLPIHTTPDALIQNASAQCAGDSMEVTLQVCNADSVALPTGTPVSFYADNPTTTTAALLGTVLLPTVVAPGECEVFTIEIPLPINQAVFVVVNDSGITPTPFDLETDFPNTITNECDFTNNLFSFTVDYVPPALDLGPDLSTCHFEVVELDAGAGFSNYQWSVPGNDEQTYTAWEPGTYSVTVTDACGGTQSDDITISVLPTTIVEIGVDTVLICAGGSVSFTASGFAGYQWFPSELVNCDTCATITATSTVDTCLTLLVASTDGCYSTDTVCLQIIPPVLTSDTINFCQGDTVPIFGNPVTMPGDYSETFTTPNGCDSIHTVTLLLGGDTLEIHEVASICEGEIHVFFGDTLTVAGIYENFDAPPGGCIVRNSLELNVLDTFFTIENISICEGETADVFGTPTSTAGTYTMFFAAQNGCDSTHAIILAVSDTASTSETISICENGTADIFGIPTNVPGIYSQSFQTFNGCDSMHTITLVVADTLFTMQTLAICAGDSALIFGNWEMQPGVFSQIFNSASGCDSIASIELMVNDVYETNESITICENETVDIFGVSTNLAGVYTQTLQTSEGCDSTHTITLVVLDTAATSEVITICENEMADIFGTPTNLPGTYSETFPNAVNCDSTHTIVLVVNDTFMVGESILICMGDSALVFGNWETQPGIFTQVFSSTEGCDSTVTVELAVVPISQTNESITICENETADVFGTPTSVAGIYAQTFPSSNGCDSTHTINLTVLDTFLTNETIIICENEMADIFGNLTNVPGTYSQNFPAANSCDSLHTITLLVNDTVQTVENISICFGDSALIFGNWETMPGGYSQILQALNGCDSTHTVTLEVGSQVSLSLQAQSGCAGQMDGSVEATVVGGAPPYTFQWSIPGQTGSTLSGLQPGQYAVTVTDANGCTAEGGAQLDGAITLDLQMDIADASCFGFADGSLSVAANLPDLLYSFDGITYQPGTNWANMPAGSYTLFVQNEDGCEWEFPVEIGQPGQVFVSLPADVTIELGETITIQANTVQDSLLFAWMPPLWLNCDDCPDPAASPETTTLYTVTVFDQNDCSDSDSILVTVEFLPNVFVPNAFSPNGDGINDVFFINAKGVVEVQFLQIFDRWGELVFEGSNFPPNDPFFGWDGTFKGKKMNPAVFAWYAELVFLDGKKRTFKGDLTLLR